MRIGLVVLCELNGRILLRRTYRHATRRSELEFVPGPRKDEPEETEALGEIVELTPDELDDAIKSGEVRDGATICAVHFARLTGALRD